MMEARKISPLDWNTKLRVLEEFKIHGYKPTVIARELNGRGYKVTKYSVRYLLKKVEKSDSIMRQEGSGRPSKIKQPHVMSAIQQSMRRNDETTGIELSNIFHNILSDRSCLRMRHLLGWESKKTQYGQSVRPKNCTARQEFAIELMQQLEWNKDTVSKTAFLWMRPTVKHPPSVMVWDGISKNGKTNIFVSKGIMYREHYAAVMKDHLLPFVKEAYPNGNHRLWQDNDPKHNSRLLKEFMNIEDVNWVRTPAESPDMNPIEMVWKELKAWIKKTCKDVYSQQGLIEQIMFWWENIFTVEMCRKYINHLHKVVPAVIMEEGHPTKH